MTDFDYPGFYDFETTDNFLQSILGAAQSLSPTLVNGDDKQMNDWLMNMDYQLPLEKHSVDLIDAAGGFKSSSMSSSSYLQDSNLLGGLTPESQDTAYSNRTSPLSVKREEPVLPKRLTEEKKPVHTTSKVAKPPTRKDKVSHNQIERKYRTNINTKILALRDAVPSLRIAAGCEDVSVADLEGLTPASKLNKASVLDKATEYIRHLEKKNRSLVDQNRRIQQLIQQASVAPVSPEPNPNRRFGFAPSTSYNTTPAVPFGQGNNSIPAEYQQSRPTNKFLMGGMAAMVGTSLFSGDLDFKNLSAIPIFPLAFASTISLHIWRLAKIALVAFAVASILEPYFRSRKTSKTTGTGFSQFLVHLGVRLPPRITETQFSDITARLLGKSGAFTSGAFVRTYFQLASCEITFESCMLCLIVGSIICSEHPFLGRLLSISLHKRSVFVKNLEYTGDKTTLKQLYMLIKKTDGLGMFNSSELVGRLANLALHRGVNDNFAHNPMHLKYVELLQDNADDYFGLVLSWRILELVRELDTSYLEYVSGDKNDEDMQKIESKAVLLCEVVDAGPKHSSLRKYYMLFQAIVNDGLTVSLLEDLEKNVNESLKQFGAAEMLDLESSGSASAASAASGADSDLADDESEKVTLLDKKTLIESLNIVSEEQFLVLVCTLAISYKSKDLAQSWSLLKYLNFASEKPALSMLTFTAIVRVIDELSAEVGDDDDTANAILDRLVRVVRFWINDRAASLSMPEELCGSLSSWIVDKGIKLSGIQVAETDE